MEKNFNSKKIGSRLATIRKEKGLTQEQLSDKIHISSTHISTVENGGSYSLDVLLSICDGLDTRLDYILYGNLRSKKVDNLNDLASICADEDLDVLLAVAQVLVDKRHK